MLSVLLLQLACVKSEMSKLNSTLEEERQLAGQHLLALQAQISEAQARAKVRSSNVHTNTCSIKTLNLAIMFL